MNDLLKPISINCPYCGETFEILIDVSPGDQNYIEDCQICCSPIDFSIELSNDGELSSIRCKRDSD